MPRQGNRLAAYFTSLIRISDIPNRYVSFFLAYDGETLFKTLDARAVQPIKIPIPFREKDDTVA